MRIFAPDLIRNFAIGFALAAIGMGVANAQQMGAEMAPAAHAAEPLAAPQVSAEFAIEPLVGETD